MRLYIAEKPSLGRAIAAVLPKPHNKQQGWIEAADGSIVSWCIGHLLEQAEPDAYDSQYKSWKLEHLPIVPQQWQLKAKPKTRSQLTVLRKLVKQAVSQKADIVHCGDPDREGQLLVDEVLDHLKLSNTKKSQVQRCLISDLNPSAVAKAVANVRSNQEFVSLSASALARSRADWLYGLNMTRAYTLQGQKAGYKGVLSVGRVQTPVLGLVVRRDIEIEQFVARNFHEVEAHLRLPSKSSSDSLQSDSTLTLKWQPSEACRPYQDEDGRVLHRPLAENVQQRILNQPALIEKVERKEKKQAAPLPFNLSSLQIEAAKIFGMKAQQVLDVCQSLYEKHQLITYPRSDSRHLPVEQHSMATGVIQAIANNCETLSEACQQANPNLKSKAWNDKKVEAHHAIIPTQKGMEKKTTSMASLSAHELKIYQHIARQYLMQFYPAHEYAETKVEAIIAGGLFKTQAKQNLKLGWKLLYNSNKSSQEYSLPDVQQGQQWLCHDAQVIDKTTQPPEHFNDATLLAAMTGISRFVENSDIRKTLRDTDGLGTEATRAGIIELLFKRKFLIRNGKQIKATEIGRGLIQSLPPQSVTPDMTAVWEQQLNGISERQLKYQDFMQPLEQQLHNLMLQAKQQIPTALQSLKGHGVGYAKKSSKRSNYKKKR